MVVRTQRINPELISAAALMAVAILLVDLSLPLGVAGGVPYVALVLTGWWFHRRSDIFVLAAVSSVLTAAAYLFSPEGQAAIGAFRVNGQVLFKPNATAVTN